MWLIYSQFFFSPKVGKFLFKSRKPTTENFHLTCFCAMMQKFPTIKKLKEIEKKFKYWIPKL